MVINMISFLWWFLILISDFFYQYLFPFGLLLFLDPRWIVVSIFLEDYLQASQAFQDTHQ